MISTRNPESMTADERCQEVAAILAGGLLRYLRAAKPPESPPPETSSEARRKGLDVRPETRLSVAQRPAG
jgi:hypothetical protein